jgi:steroid delta-isomerase-like uncharacterized protein
MPGKSLLAAAKAPVLAYNRKDWTGLEGALKPGFVLDEVPTGRKTRGVSGALAVFQAWAKAMPDSKATVNSTLVKGNTVVMQVTWRGTHTGPLPMPSGDVPPTGKKFEVRACQVIEIDRNKAKSLRHYFDINTLLRQIGVVS